MLAAIASLTVLGAILGLGLGVAARKFAVEGDPLADEIAALMPGSNCGQCGMAGCAVAAKAIAEGTATATVCPPGGIACDPFMGSGTSAVACAMLGRRVIGGDIGARETDGKRWADIARERAEEVANPAQRPLFA